MSDRLSASVVVLLLAGFAVTAPPASAQSPGAAQTPPRTLTQVEALTIALQQNQQLRVAAYEVSVARAQLAQARAGTAIQTNAQGSYTRTQEGSSTTVPFSCSAPPCTLTIPAPSPDVYDARLVLQYPLYSGGRIEAQIALAEANLRGAEATFERVKQQIVFSVRQAYFSLLLAQAGRQAADRSAAQANENLRVARARVAAGVSPRFDEVQALVAVASAQQAQVRARSAVAQATQGLDALLNLPLDTPVAPAEPFAVVPVETPLDRLLVRALETRPELAEARARINAAQAAVQLAESGGRLNLGLAGAYIYSNSGPFGPGTTMASTWSVTLAATLNVSDGGLTKERSDEARQRLEQLKAAEAQQRQAIELEVRQAYLNLQSAREEMAVADALVAQATEAQRIANVRFEAGVGTSLEVLSAQASSSQADTAKSQAQFSYNVARAALEHAVGETVR